MSAPNYDWLACLSTIQQKFMEDKYKDLYDTYKCYGYSVTMYDYGRIIDKVYDEVKSVNITEHIDLPPSLNKAMQKFSEVQAAAGNLKEIVVGVSGYHVILLGRDERLLSELRHIVNDTYVLMQKRVDDVLLRAGNNCVIVDDYDVKYYEDDLADMELHAVPYLRRSVAGWSTPVIEKSAENVILHFIERSKPCKLIRKLNNEENQKQ